MKTGAAAKRYAKAIFSLGVETNEFEMIETELRCFHDAMEANEDLKHLLLSPLYDWSTKKDVVTAICSKGNFNTLTKNFLLVLIDKGRLVLFPDIIQYYQELSDKKAGRISATTVTASALSDSVTRELIASLEKNTGKRVMLKQEVDPTIIGGIVIKVGDIIYDGSIQTQLNRIIDNITRIN